MALASPDNLPKGPSEKSEGLFGGMLENLKGSFNFFGSSPEKPRSRLDQMLDSRAEQKKLSGSAINRFTAKTGTTSELYVHGKDVMSDASGVTEDLVNVREIWDDEPELKEKLDSLDKYQSKHGNIVSALPSLSNKKTKSEKNKNKSSRAKDKKAQALRTKTLKEWKRFAYKKEGRSVWRKKSISSVINIHHLRAHWQNSGGIISFLKNIGKDFAQWQATGQAIPAVNVAILGTRGVQEKLKHYDNEIERAGDIVSANKKLKKTKRIVQQNGAETALFLSDRGAYVRSKLLEVIRGNITREDMMGQIKMQFEMLRKQDPEAFAKVVKKSGVKARSFNTRAGFYEVIKNTTNWYVRPSERGEESLWKKNETAVPIWGSVASWRDIKQENGLPLWARVGFASVGTLFDVGTVASFGLLSPLMIAGKVAVAKTAQLLGKTMARKGAEKAASLGAKTTMMAQVRGFFSQLSQASRKALSVPSAGKFMTGAAAYTGFSFALDWLFDIEDKVFDLVANQVERKIEMSLNRQQRRLIKMTLGEVGDIVDERFEEHKKERAERKVISSGVKSEAEKKRKNNELLPA